jgi:5-methylcytosine-specific restriction protein A
MTKPLSPCPQPGCHELTSGGRCDAHRREQYREQNANRPSPRQQGYDSNWERARRAWLFEHPLCVACHAEGRLTAATVVDHIVPHRGDRRLFWDRGNWQSLCKPCHDRKTARQDGGFGRQGVGGSKVWASAT